MVGRSQNGEHEDRLLIRGKPSREEDTDELVDALDSDEEEPAEEVLTRFSDTSTQEEELVSPLARTGHRTPGEAACGNSPGRVGRRWRTSPGVMWRLAAWW